MVQNSSYREMPLMQILMAFEPQLQRLNTKEVYSVHDPCQRREESIKQLPESSNYIMNFHCEKLFLIL